MRSISGSPLSDLLPSPPPQKSRRDARRAVPNPKPQLKKSTVPQPSRPLVKSITKPQTLIYHSRPLKKLKSFIPDPEEKPFPDFGGSSKQKRPRQQSVDDDELMGSPPPIDAEAELRRLYGTASFSEELRFSSGESDTDLSPPPSSSKTLTVEAISQTSSGKAGGPKRKTVEATAGPSSSSTLSSVPRSPPARAKGKRKHRESSETTTSSLSSAPTSPPPRNARIDKDLDQSAKGSKNRKPSPRRDMKPNSDDEDDDDDDHLPDLEAILNQSSDDPLLMSEMADDDDLEGDEIYDTLKQFRPTIPRSDQEPGESCYVLKNDQYIPAFISFFTPAESLYDRRGDRWTVETYTGVILEDRRADKKPKQIIFQDDQEIADCKLAKVTSKNKGGTKSDAATRAPSPPYDFDLISTTFAELSQNARFRFIRPHLQSIINETYSPAQDRIDNFFQNRARTRDNGDYFGDVTEKEASNWFLPELRRWALRGERKVLLGLEMPANEPHRPVGSDRYESMQSTTRDRFVRDVLLPESIIHMCILSNPHPSSDPTITATTPALTQQELYDSAKVQLRHLSESDVSNAWESRLEELKSWRANMRRQRGLPEELTKGEKEWEDLKGKEMGWAGGRMVSKKNYKV